MDRLSILSVFYSILRCCYLSICLVVYYAMRFTFFVYTLFCSNPSDGFCLVVGCFVLTRIKTRVVFPERSPPQRRFCLSFQVVEETLSFAYGFNNVLYS